MEDFTATPASVVADGSAPLGAGAPGGGVPPPNANAAAPQQPGPNDPNKVMTIPHSAMQRIRGEERDKGRKEALAELAKSAGFGSDMELVQALASLKNPSPPQQQQTQQQQTPQPPQNQAQPQTPPPAAPTGDPVADRNQQRAAAKYERDLERLTRERDSYVQRYTVVNQELKKAKEQLDAKEAEFALREIAVSSGVTDVDYALRLYYREVENKSEEELAKLDERTFFSGLRGTRPYLFGEVVKPATTGPGVGGGPTAPKPGQVTQQTAANGSFDGRRASQQDVQDRLRKMGLNPHL